MQETEIHEHARKLLETRGGKAVADAARHADTLEQEGKQEEAVTWRRIESALKLMRGPHQS